MRLNMWIVIVFVGLVLLAPLFSTLASADSIPVTISWEAPTVRLDGSPVVGSMQYQLFKNNEVLWEGTELEYTDNLESSAVYHIIPKEDGYPGIPSSRVVEIQRALVSPVPITITTTSTVTIEVK